MMVQSPVKPDLLFLEDSEDIFKPDENGYNRWDQLYEFEDDPPRKLLIAGLAILEKLPG